MSVWKVLHLIYMYIPGSPQFLSVLGVNPKDCQKTAALPEPTKVASYRIGCGGSRNVQTVLLTACFDLSRLPSPSMFSFSDFPESFLHIIIWGSCWRLAALNEANRKALVFSLQCLDSSSGSGLSCSLKPGLELWPLLGNRSQRFPFEMRSHQGCTSHRVLCLFWWCVISNSKLIDPCSLSGEKLFSILAKSSHFLLFWVVVDTSLKIHTWLCDKRKGYLLGAKNKAFASKVVPAVNKYEAVCETGWLGLFASCLLRSF